MKPMVNPRRTKPCTFPHCDSRMILKVAPDGPNQAMSQARWECDKDDSHLERPKPGEL
jgi:hypothetical protein